MSGVLPVLSRRVALAFARRLGCSVEPVRGTGEVRIRHPDLPRPITLNNRRHDASRTLMKAIRHLTTIERRSA